MSLAGNKKLWIVIVLCVVLAALSGWLFFGSYPFTLLVLYDQVGSLKKDAPVVWKNFTIGKVVDIQPLVDNQVGVTIRLREEYAPKITHGSEFYLKPASMLGLLGDDSIEVVTPDTPGAPFASGEKIQGKRRATTSLFEEGVKWSQEYLRQLKDQTSKLIEEFENSPYRKQVEDAARDLRDITERGAGLAKEQVEEFQRRHAKDLARIRKKLEQIRDEMRKKGDEAGARRLEEQIEKIDKR